jgi:hypothetical protein
VRSESGDTSRQITKSSRILNSSSSTYELQDTPSTGQTQTDPDFVHRGMNNYAQVPDLDWTTLKNLPLNPVNLVPGAAQYSGGFKPIYMINSYIDHPSAYHQLVTMVCLLLNSGLTRYTDFDYLTIPGSTGHLHSFQYWESWDHLPSLDYHTVGEDVISYLKTKAGLQ